MRAAVVFDLEIVVAADRRRGIGRAGGLAWRLKGDMKRFRRLTGEAPEERRNAVIMGRRTWESIPARFRPLKGRVNVVLTRDERWPRPAGVVVASSFEHALERLAETPRLGRVFVIGGAAVYAAALERPECRRVHLTEVDGDHACDTFLPAWPEGFHHVQVGAAPPETHTEGGISYRFVELERRSSGSSSV